jgi:hypothetical protein
MASRFAELRELEKEEKRRAKEEMRLSEEDSERLFGTKNWRGNPKVREKLKQWEEKTLAEQRAERKRAAEKAAADMRSGKKSSLVGAGGDPYAGVQGPLPMYRTPEEADAAGQSRYLLNEEEQYMPAPAYVGRSEAERAEMETSGEYPEVGKYKKTEGKGVEVRKATPTKKVFKAMVEGDPSQDKVFDTKEEANAYLKQMGGKGAVAGVRISGSPEEMAASEEKYKGQAGSAAKKEEELKSLYAKRRAAAQERIGRIKSGEIDARSAAIESQIEDIAEKEPKRAKQFESALNRVSANRAEREKQIISERIKNVAEGKAGMPFGETERIAKMENRANKIARDLRGMYDKAVRAGNYDAALEIEGLIKETVGTDPRSVTAKRQFFREKLNRANPF